MRRFDTSLCWVVMSVTEVDVSVTSSTNTEFGLWRLEEGWPPDTSKIVLKTWVLWVCGEVSIDYRSLTLLNGVERKGKVEWGVGWIHDEHWWGKFHCVGVARACSSQHLVSQQILENLWKTTLECRGERLNEKGRDFCRGIIIACQTWKRSNVWNVTFQRPPLCTKPLRRAHTTAQSYKKMF